MVIKNITKNHYEFFKKQIKKKNSFINVNDIDITSIVYSENERTLTIEYTNPLIKFVIHEIFSMYFIDAETIIELKKIIKSYKQQLKIVKQMMKNYSEYSLMNNNSNNEDVGDSFVIMSKSSMIFNDLKQCLEDLNE